MNDKQEKQILHAIQLLHLGVKELHIVSNVPPDVSVKADVERCSLTHGHGKYDVEHKTIIVGTKVELGFDANQNSTPPPYSMRIELIGVFQVDETRFPTEHLNHWAENNAPLILYPYLREQAFALTARCGFTPLLLPLLEVPTFKIQKPRKPKSKKPQ